MNHITYRISLDLRKTDAGVVVKVKRDDTVKKLAISLTDGGKPYHITEDCRAVFAGEKPDGTILCNPCSIEDCVVTYEITPQTIAELGEVKSEIRLYSTDGDLVTSPSFTILVVPPVYDDDRVIESHDEVNALTELITSATSTIQKGEAVVQQGDVIFAGLQDKEEELDQYVEILSQVPTKYVSLEAQETTDVQKQQARKNIDAVSTSEHTALKETVQTTAQDLDRVAEVVEDAVLTTGQALTEEQRAQARDNIGAGSKAVVDSLSARLANGSVTFVDEREGVAETLFLEQENLYLTERDRVVAVLTSGYQYLTEEQKAQARDNIGAISADEIPLSKEKVYEKIATITVTPDADGSLPQYVTFTADSNGNPFELTDFIVQARAGFVDGNKSGLYMSVNNNKLLMGNSAVSGISATPRSFTIFYRQENDGSVRAEHTVSGSSTSFYNPASAINESRVVAPEVMTGFAGKTVTKIDLYTLTGDTKAWVEGSTFELWGVRA